MSDLFHDIHWLIPLSVFVGAFVGSPHCMVMCGPIVLNFANQKKRLIAYQTGRLSSYVAAGTVAGGIGESVFTSTQVPWIANLSMMLIGLFLILNGYRAFAGRPLHLPFTKVFSRIANAIWSQLKLSRLPNSLAAALAGVFTVFLPCGHLYGFLLGAAATGSAAKGAMFMFAFWFGSMPLMSFGGIWIQKFFRPRIASGQRWAGVLLILAGLSSIAAFGLRSQSREAHAQELSSPVTQRPSCH